MDHSQAKETTCKYCNDVFPSKGKYDYHFRRIHQNEVKIHGHNQEGTSVQRSENEKFVCICDKSYHIWQALHRHQKGCQRWKDHEASLNSDSDSEMSVLGNFYIHCILLNL